MEGLIPLFLNAIKKQRPQGACTYRTLSEGSNRSYHLLLGGGGGGGGDSVEGSSHRRSQSDFQPPPMDLSTMNKGSNMFGEAYAARISTGASNFSSNLRRRR